VFGSGLILPFIQMVFYLTGLSMGGYGVTAYGYYFPTMFAAIAPMSGTMDFGWDAEPPVEPTRLPTWVFNGSIDPISPAWAARAYVTNLTGVSTITFNQTNYGYPTAVVGPVRYTELTDRGHNIWNFIYDNPSTDFYDWLFAQRRPAAKLACNVSVAPDGSLFLNGASDVPLGSARVLCSTNVGVPLSQWLCPITNWFDVNGRFSIPLNGVLNEKQRFFSLESP
jgi:hypothetical protein